jgi:hypothetical protein
MGGGKHSLLVVYMLRTCERGVVPVFPVCVGSTEKPSTARCCKIFVVWAVYMLKNLPDNTKKFVQLVSYVLRFVLIVFEVGLLSLNEKHC